MEFLGGTVRIRRLSKAIAEIEDVLMLDVLSLPAELEASIAVETVDWQDVSLRTVVHFVTGEGKG